MVRLEGRVDHLEQTLGGDALGGVGVPEVDGLRVAGRLPHDVAVDAVVGARDALGLHDVQRLLDPAVEVVGVGLRGGRGRDGLALLRAARGLLLGALLVGLRLRGGLGVGLLLGLGLGLRLLGGVVGLLVQLGLLGLAEGGGAPRDRLDRGGLLGVGRGVRDDGERDGGGAGRGDARGGELVDLGQAGITGDGGAHAELNLFQSRESQWPVVARKKRRFSVDGAVRRRNS